ncbi:MAG: DUF1385 domain-containing protein [Candidatus Gracilibacteria bacterium]|nr:DUF1385 domain-containing protein [Candidatus Gracilibacteria bacterium]
MTFLALLKPLDLAVGGQAVMEGVMMRAPRQIVIAVRDSKGKIQLKKDPFRALVERYKFLNIPILRGVINMGEMLYIGTKALNWSAEVALGEEGKQKSKLGGFVLGAFSLVFGIMLALLIFKFTPLYLAGLLQKIWPFLEEHWLLFNAVDGLAKLILLIAYLYLIGLMPDVKRVFEYHGAEHKSIFTYELGQELTVKNAKKNTRFHPRCGTSFLVIVFLLSILVYTVLPRDPSFWVNLENRLLVLPLIAGIAYELLKLSGKYRETRLAKIFSLPGLWTQRLTTREPDGKQMEVALKALKEALGNYSFMKIMPPICFLRPGVLFSNLEIVSMSRDGDSVERIQACTEERETLHPEPMVLKKLSIHFCSGSVAASFLTSISVWVDMAF